MLLGLKSSASRVLCLVGIITVGTLSRVVHTGLVVFDKYLGDALYAAMVYTILRLVLESCGACTLGRVRDGRNDRHRVVSTDDDSGALAGERACDGAHLRAPDGDGVQLPGSAHVCGGHRGHLS